MLHSVMMVLKSIQVDISQESPLCPNMLVSLLISIKNYKCFSSLSIALPFFNKNPLDCIHEQKNKSLKSFLAVETVNGLHRKHVLLVHKRQTFSTNKKHFNHNFIQIFRMKGKHFITFRKPFQ
jgi:hypothetical protein